MQSDTKESNKKDGGKPNRKQLKFCELYLDSFNGTKAAIAAGYSKKCAAEIAYELLRKPHIKNFIEQRTQEILADIGVNKRRVLTEVARIAYFNPKKLFDKKGNLLPIHKLDDATASALAGIKIGEIVSSEGASKKLTTQMKSVKWIGKDSALFNLVKHLDLAGVEKVDITSKGKELQGLTEKTVVKATLKLS